MPCSTCKHRQDSKRKDMCVLWTVVIPNHNSSERVFRYNRGQVRKKGTGRKESTEIVETSKFAEFPMNLLQECSLVREGNHTRDVSSICTRGDLNKLISLNPSASFVHHSCHHSGVPNHGTSMSLMGISDKICSNRGGTARSATAIMLKWQSKDTLVSSTLNKWPMVHNQTHGYG